MEFEALLPRFGELCRQDVRVVLGDAYETASTIKVLVLGRPGEMPSAGVVELGWSQGGRGQQRMLICPACGGGRRALHTDGIGGLRCAACLRLRTRHQLEKRRADFRDLGGREEDQLLRAVGHGNGGAHIAQLAVRIVGADYARLDALRAKVRAALAVVEAGR